MSNVAGRQMRRVHRLLSELADEGIDLPADEEWRALVLTELDAAVRPRAFEGVAPGYGALVLPREHTALDAALPHVLIAAEDVPLSVVRTLAEGRSAFLVRHVGGRDRLVCFDRPLDDESTVVQLAVTTSSVVIQRLRRGWVRLCTGEGVTVWDGVRWQGKPLARSLVDPVRAAVPQADPLVLSRLLEFCMHWLDAGRVGAALIWDVDGDPHELGHLGMGASVRIPTLDLTQREHFAPLLSVLSQSDRAVLVDEAGAVTTIGVQMRSSERSRREVDVFRGTRHTAALRFSRDEPRTLVFVVSSSGELTICRNGERLQLG